jgi:hypothetical protein
VDIAKETGFDRTAIHRRRTAWKLKTGGEMEPVKPPPPMSTERNMNALAQMERGIKSLGIAEGLAAEAFRLGEVPRIVAAREIRENSKARVGVSTALPVLIAKSKDAILPEVLEQIREEMRAELERQAAEELMAVVWPILNEEQRGKLEEALRKSIIPKIQSVDGMQVLEE